MVGDFPRELARPQGGVESVVGCLADGLVRSGVELSIVHYGAPGSGESRHPELGCRLIGLPRIRPAGLTFSTLMPALVGRALERLEPDVVHVQGLPELYRGWSRPSVLTIHGIPHQDARYRSGRLRAFAPIVRARGFRRALGGYTRIIAISPSVLDEAGIERASCRSIPNPVDDGFFAVKRRPLSNTILYVGVLSRLKNARLLVEAAARLKERFPELRFRMAGAWDSDYRPELMAEIARSDLGETFEFLGSLGRVDLARELSTCTALVLPSLQETSPMAVHEAMAAGVPVVASAVGGVPHILEQGELGLLFDRNDAEGLVRQLGAVLGDPGRRERMSGAAKAKAERSTRIDSVVKATCEVYTEAIEAFGPRVRSSGGQ